MHKMKSFLDTISRLLAASSNNVYKTKLSDVYEALLDVSSLDITNLPEDMKLALVDNLLEAKVMLAEETFNFYTEVEFEVIDLATGEVMQDVVDVMREVVRSTLTHKN